MLQERQCRAAGWLGSQRPPPRPSVVSLGSRLQEVGGCGAFQQPGNGPAYGVPDRLRIISSRVEFRPSSAFPPRNPVPLLAVADAEAIGLMVMFDVALVVAASLFFARVLRRMGQPAVVGEILAGLALGPSLLGLIAPDLPGLLFPDDARAYLKVVANLGLVLFMFGVGFESDLGLMRRMGRRTAVLSTGSIAVPMLVGALVAIPLWSAHDVVDGAAVPRAAFVAFIAVALSVTAFPVLARILSEAGLLRDPIGSLAMSIAAGTDLVAWTALAVIVGVFGDGGQGSIPQLLASAVAYGLLLVFVVRPLIGHVLGRLRGEGRTAAAAAVLLIGLLLSAAATGRMGLHPAIGAFAFGVVCPRTGAATFAAQAGAASLHQAGLLFIPIFFLTTGLTVDLTGLDLAGLAQMAILLVAAVGAKFVGVLLAARLCRMGWRSSAALGTLMNARGLTELVILEVGRSSGILDDQTFTALVGVAIITTVMTGPVFRRLHPHVRPAEVRPRPAHAAAVPHPAPKHA